MTVAQNHPPLPTRRFAWDGVSFLVPENWDLAVFQHRRRHTRIELDDDYTVRLEGEWIRSRRDLEIQKIQKRYDQAARVLNQDAQQIVRLGPLPDDWVACLYVMPENQRLLSVFHLHRESGLFCFLMLHFGPEAAERPGPVLEAVVRSFRLHEGPVAPWELYDIRLEMPAEFRLAHTDFQTGNKLMLFQWRGRRFYLWHVSLADLILKRHTLEAWAVDLLNTSWLIKGPIFSVGEDQKLTWRRRWRHRLTGHYDEIYRWCFSYELDIIHDQEANRLIVWLYNYRDPDDLRQLELIRVGDDRMTLCGRAAEPAGSHPDTTRDEA